MFIENLYIFRKEHKKTQRDIADFLGITEAAYAHYEKGRRDPSIESIINLASFYNCSVDQLLNIENSSNIINKFPVGYKPGVGFIEEDGARLYFKEHALFSAASDGSEISDDIIIQLANDLYEENN